MYKEKVFVCGGDIRSIYAAKYFSSMGYDVLTTGLEEGKEADISFAKEADIVMLGLPCILDNKINMPLCKSKVGFESFLSMCRKESFICGGSVGEEFFAMAKNKGVIFADYSKDKLFMEENAFYTAEGTLSTLIQSTPFSLCGMKILITGSGRISKALCSLLISSPARLFVAARSQEKSQIFTHMGAQTIWPVGDMSQFDVVINTVPCDILTENSLKTLKRDSLILDLSARPGYVNKDLCKKYSLNLMCLPGIPKSSAPCSAGESAARAALRLYAK